MSERCRPRRACFAQIIILVIIIALLASCAETGGAGEGLTPEFKAFLEIRKSRPQSSRTENGGGFYYVLENGALRVYDTACKESILLWQSNKSWYVEDFRLGDVNGDGSVDVLFTLWKSYRFGPYHPERMDNDDPSVRCHLFLYSMRGGQMKSLWGSSDLQRPIYEFELSFDGKKSPVASGAVLRTAEGLYRADFSHTEIKEFVYIWQGWGFVET